MPCNLSPLITSTHQTHGLQNASESSTEKFLFHIHIWTEALVWPKHMEDSAAIVKYHPVEKNLHKCSAHVQYIFHQNLLLLQSILCISFAKRNLFSALLLCIFGDFVDLNAHAACIHFHALEHWVKLINTQVRATNKWRIIQHPTCQGIKCQKYQRDATLHLALFEHWNDLSTQNMSGPQMSKIWE